MGSGNNEDDDDNNNDDDSAYGSIGSFNDDDDDDEDDNNNKNVNKVQIVDGDPTIPSSFRIAFNQNHPNHQDNNGFRNVKNLFVYLNNALGKKMIIVPT